MFIKQNPLKITVKKQIADNVLRKNAVIRKKQCMSEFFAFFAFGIFGGIQGKCQHCKAFFDEFLCIRKSVLQKEVKKFFPELRNFLLQFFGRFHAVGIKESGTASDVFCDPVEGGAHFEDQLTFLLELMIFFFKLPPSAGFNGKAVIAFSIPRFAVSAGGGKGIGKTVIGRVEKIEA